MSQDLSRLQIFRIRVGSHSPGKGLQRGADSEGQERNPAGGNRAVDSRSYCEGQRFLPGKSWERFLLYFCQLWGWDTSSPFCYLPLVTPSCPLNSNILGQKKGPGPLPHAPFLEEHTVVQKVGWADPSQVPWHEGHTRGNTCIATLFSPVALSVSFCNFTSTYFIYIFAIYNWSEYQWLRLCPFRGLRSGII